jgi:acyl-CoA thioesterase FadM
MQKLNESPVTPDQIDSLGHLNVRYYIARMDLANRQLLEANGVSGDEHTFLRRVDTYNKFRREQFNGAVLGTYGALIGKGVIGPSGSVPAYFEIRNEETGVVAASFLTATSRVDRATQAPHDLSKPQDQTRLVGTEGFEPPASSLPRTLSLSEPRVIPMATLEQELPAEPVQGNMTGRRENTVKSEDCDANGRLREDVDLMTIVFRVAPDDEEQAKNIGPIVQQDAQGRRFAWAMMETRSYVFRYPDAGHRVVALSVDLDFGEKWRHTRRFMFNGDRGDILGVYDSIGICIDLDARRAIATPPSVVEGMRQTVRPDWR